MGTEPARDPAGPVVVGCDGSDPAARALDVAVDEANRRGTGLVVVVIAGHSGFWSDGGQDTYGDAPAALDRATTLSEAAVDRAVERSPDLRVDALVCSSLGSSGVADLGRRAQLLVLGRRGRGGQHCLAGGSTSADLVRAFSCPVLVASPSDAACAAGVVVAGVDGGEHSTAVLQVAAEECRLSHRDLVAVHAYGGSDAPPQHRSDVCKRLFDQALRSMDDQSARADRLVFSRGGPVDALTGWARSGDLLVLGAHARGPVRASSPDDVIRRVLDHATCDVLVVPAGLG